MVESDGFDGAVVDEFLSVVYMKQMCTIGRNVLVP